MMSAAPNHHRDRRVLLIGTDEDLLARLREREEVQDMVFDHVPGNLAALQRLRGRDYDVLVTNPATSVPDDLVFAEEVRALRRSTRIIVLAPAALQQDVIAALRAQVFACFSAPFDAGEVAAMIAAATDLDDWRGGIEVISGLPDWISLRVSSRRVSAERLIRFMTEYRTDLPESERTDLMTAFREMILNAMEHGAHFDPDKIVEVSAARTEPSDRLLPARPRAGIQSRQSAARRGRPFRGQSDGALCQASGARDASWRLRHPARAQSR